MAGHSQFKNIMHRKGAQDAKRAKVFTKIIRELTVAAQTGGDDPESNPRLRTAIQTARGANMPKDTMERAIKKGSGKDSDTTYFEMRYEGYGPAGMAIIVEALTDNKNRTAAEVRALFNRNGGNMGETGSVSFSFQQMGIITYGKDVAGEDALLEGALAAGAEDMTSEAEAFQIKAPRNSWMQVKEQIEKDFGEPLSAGLAWLPSTLVTLPPEKKETAQKLIDALENNDDVQSVWHNATLDDS